MESWKKPTSEMVDRALRSVEKGTIRKYFFSRLENPLWIQPLVEREVFASPPEAVNLPDGSIQFPFWPELQYLKNVAKCTPDEVAGILSTLPKVKNPHVYSEILEIALDLPGKQSARLKDKMLEYTELEFQTMAHRYSSLLAYWTTEEETDAALLLATKLIGFLPDRKDSEKRSRNKEDSDGLSTYLEPVPRFESWDYREILTTGVRPLIEKEPCKTACILISAVARMTCLEMHQDQIEKDGDEDYSEVWYPRLSGKYEGYGEPKELLIYTMTSACEQVYEEDPDSIEDLDEQLRKQRWKLFKRLRQHLYAHYPTQQTKPWIQEVILSHDDFGRSEYHYEFNLMVRRALECFGEELLSTRQRTSIFNTILDGPSKKRFKEQYGDRYSASLFAQRQRHFHRMQLKPFASVLFGKILEYFEELEREAEEDISDEDYSPISETEAGFVSRQSPITAQELAAKSDQDFLYYINAWQEEQPFVVEEDGSFTEISTEGLAEAFQTAFKVSILPNPDRFGFWLDNRDRIERPIYVRAMIEGMAKRIEDKDFVRLDECLDFCEWVLSHPDRKREADFGRGEQSRLNPNWARARQAVGNLIHSCTKKEVNAPIDARGRLAKLLELLCTQFDWQLDKDNPDYFGSNDYLTTAINNTRSRALEYLMEFGLWLQRIDPDTDFGEVKTVLLKRFAIERDLPLTLPERAILGANYVRLLGFDETWALDHKSDIFPQKRPDDWQVAFGSYLRRFGPNVRAFEELGKDYEFGVQQLTKIKGRDESDREFSDYLGQHLFMYYLWDLYPLKGEDSLLERYYLGTEHDRKRWSNLVDHLGLKLENTKEDLPEDLKCRLVEFFEWRLELGDSDELVHYSALLKANCLEAEWRLNAFSRVLDATRGSTFQAVSIVAKSLEEMLPGHTTKVVECFAKLTDTPNDSTFYVGTETAKRIIRAGLDSGDEDAESNATRARENLLRKGYFDLLNLDD